MTDAAASQVWGWLDRAWRQREQAGLIRVLDPRPPASDLIDLAGNDYLGMATHPEVVAAAAEATRIWGAGSTGSRLVTGSTRAHAALEAELAAFTGFEAALVFSSGYTANLGALAALAGPDALLVSDERNHASLIDGCRLARAEVTVTPHADPPAVVKALQAHDGRGVVVTDAVFSVDGARAPLPALAAAVRDHHAVLVADDAHGLGVVGPEGRGAVHASGLAGDGQVVATVTLSKALGSQGGAVLGPRRVIDYLANTARTFIFDTGLAPGAVAAARESLRLVGAEPGRVRRLRTAITGLHERLADRGLPVEAAAGGGAVVAVRAPSAHQATAWASRCRERGVRVGCFRPPSVFDGVSRLRCALRADLSDADLDRVADVLASTAP